MKKTLSILLSLLMILSVLGAVPFSANAVPASGECGENVTYKYNITDSTLTISGYGPMYNFDEYAPEYALYRNNIIDVEIEEGVTYIGKSAFKAFPKLYNLHIANSVEEIGEDAFKDCPILMVYFYGDAQQWDHLEKGISEFNNAETFFSRGFCGEKAIYNVDIDNATLTISGSGEMYSRYEYGYNFFGGIEHIVVEDGITEIGESAFANNDFVTDVYIGNTVTSIGDAAFANCVFLKEITGADSVTSIGENAFSNCSSIEYFSVPEGVSAIPSGVFQYCIGLKTIYIPSNVTVIVPTAFYGVGDDLEVISACDNEAVRTILIGDSTRKWSKNHYYKTTNSSVSATKYARKTTCSHCGEGYSQTFDKSANPMTASGKTKTVKYTTLKKKNVTVAAKDAFAVAKNKGKVTYKKSSGNKKITVSSAGKITVKKGLKKGTYTLKVKVTAAGTVTYKAKTKTVSVKIKVK